MKNQILKLSLFMFISLNMSVGKIQAQCDTCPYTWRRDVPINYTVGVTVYPYSDTITYFPFCHEDSLWKKNVTFVHGLGGSNQSWHKPWVWTDTGFNMPTFRVTYQGWEEGFHSAAQQMKTDYTSRIASGGNQSYPTRCKKEDYVIAHSQGGIVARYLDYQWWLCEVNPMNCSGTFGTRDYYGIVTFSTPNAGAHIGLSQDEHKEMVASVIRSVILHPLTEATFDLSSLGIITPSMASKFQFANNHIDSFLKTTIAPVILGGLHTPTLNEMLPGTTTINNLATYPSNVHRVAFYGIEDAPEVWRVLDMAINVEPSDAPLFGANEDEDFMNSMENVRHEHNAKIASNLTTIKKSKNKRIIGYALGGMIGGGINHFISANKVEKLEEQNKNREKYIDFLNNANTQWRYIIGSYHRDSIDIVYSTKHEVFYKHFGILNSKVFDDATSANSFMVELHLAPNITDISVNDFMTLSKTRTFFPSDGVVLVKSQKAFPGVLEDDTDKMEHNNHFQVRNSSETERVLRSLYDEDKYDQFFRLTED